MGLGMQGMQVVIMQVGKYVRHLVVSHLVVTRQLDAKMCGWLVHYLGNYQCKWVSQVSRQVFHLVATSWVQSGYMWRVSKQLTTHYMVSYGIGIHLYKMCFPYSHTIYPTLCTNGWFILAKVIGICSNIVAHTTQDSLSVIYCDRSYTHHVMTVKRRQAKNLKKSIHAIIKFSPQIHFTYKQQLGFYFLIIDFTPAFFFQP